MSGNYTQALMHRSQITLSLFPDLDVWLQRIFEDVSFDSGPSMRKFLQSTETDCKKMDVDLSAGEFHFVLSHSSHALL